MADILIADDEEGLREGLRQLLEGEGHSVRVAANGEEALAMFRDRRPDLVLLDVMMPLKSGYEVILRIRKEDPALQVIFVTSKVADQDKVLGLGLGADDYITKPYSGPEMVARVEAALRRARLLTTLSPTDAVATSAACVDPSDAPFKVGEWRVEPSRQVLVSSAGKEEAISRRELGILRLLASNPGVIVRRERILELEWGADYPGTTRSLDNYICSLRRKLGDAADLIETVVGTGYRYRPEARG